jgi:hypothetical protein
MTMLHDPEEVIARQEEEIAQLRKEVASMKNLLIEVLRAVKEVEFSLTMALDRDR